MATVYYEFWTVEPKYAGGHAGTGGSQTLGECCASGMLAVSTSAASSVAVPANLGACVCRLAGDVPFQFAKGASPSPAAANTARTAASSAVGFSHDGREREFWVTPGQTVAVIALGS
ncbi:hypothetical protein [Pseudoxanthobacter sp.]|uniref:hypothetical protein n=1 Tax=Pseudoxanthobacter sp. TaxID=1925742 RepID=UPI002FE087AE